MPATTPVPVVVTELVEFHASTVARARQSWPMHLHHFSQLDVLLAGRLTVRVEGGRPFRARPGDGWLVPPLVRHGFEQAHTFRTVSFKLRLAPAYCPAAMPHWRRARFPRHLRDLLTRLTEASAPARIFAAATLCVLQTLEHDAPPPPADPAIDAFRQVLWPLLERIEREPCADWSVARMARLCHLSADHFSRRFHLLLGQSPRRYLLDARLRAAAAALLNDPTRPVKHVADASGYATVHAFSAAFKRTFGRGPAAYRRSQPRM